MSSITSTQRPLSAAMPSRAAGRLPLRRAILYVVFVFLTLLFTVPVIWLVLTSLKTQAEYMRYPIVIWPDSPVWSNYATAIFDYPFMKYFWNSVIVALPSTLLTVFSSALAGFGFARHNAPLKRLLFVLVLAMMMVPRMVTVIPTFILFARLGLNNTYWPWILWGIGGSSFHIFLFRPILRRHPQRSRRCRRSGRSQPLPCFLADLLAAIRASFCYLGNFSLSMGVGRLVHPQDLPQPR